MTHRSTRTEIARATRTPKYVTGLALTLGALAAARCSGSASATLGGGPEGAGSTNGDGEGNGNGSTGGIDAGTPSYPTADAAAPAHDAGPSTGGDTDASEPPDASGSNVVPCGTTSAIASLLSQYGSGSTASNVTPMGARFESAAQALPISATNATFLTTASSNPSPSSATSANLSWHAATVTLHPSTHPSPEDVMQHEIGDCDGDSAMASMAYVNPAFVESLIKDNGDGTFAVAMFDPMGKPITVAVDSQVLWDTGANVIGEVSAGDGTTADWATILEKAVMKYDYAYGMVGPIDGIGSEELVPMFTGVGGSIAFSPGTLTPSQFQQVVTVSLAAGKFITGGFNQEGLTIGDDSTVTAHGYAVMVPTDPSSDMTDMRNPWGVNPWATGSSSSGYDTSTDGLLQIPMATSPNDWSQIIDLRIIDPGPSCSAATKPFVPQIRPMATPIHIGEAHARRAR